MGENFTVITLVPLRVKPFVVCLQRLACVGVTALAIVRTGEVDFVLVAQRHLITNS